MRRKKPDIQERTWSNPWDIVFDTVYALVHDNNLPYHGGGTLISNLIREEVFRRVKNTMVINIRYVVDERVDHKINTLRKKECETFITRGSRRSTR